MTDIFFAILIAFEIFLVGSAVYAAREVYRLTRKPKPARRFTDYQLRHILHRR